MEGVTARVYKGVKGYWRRRGYQRLGGSGSRRRFWRIRITRRLKLRPKKFFIGLRDAYVRMMVRIAGSTVVNGGGIGTRPIKEYDEKMIIEMYRSLSITQAATQLQLHHVQIPTQINFSTVTE